MSPIEAYALIEAPTADSLSQLVSVRLAEGWQPYGEPFARKGQFFQAVALEHEVTKRLRKTSEDG